MKALLVGILLLLLLLLLNELRVLLGVWVVHEIAWLRLIGVGRHEIAGKVLVLTAIDGLRESGGSSRVEASICSVGVVVELEVQAQAIIIVHGVRRGVCSIENWRGRTK